MLTDREIQALFADNSESDSHKKKKPKPKASEDKKSRPAKKKAKITFDPDIFLDGIEDEQNTKDVNIETPMQFFSKNETFSILPEFSNLIGRITFYLNSQLHYLLDDFANELILMVDTTSKEKEMVDDFLNETLDEIKKLFYQYDEDSNKSTNLFNPESFDIFADRFHQSFLEAEEYSQVTYDTSQIKSLRKDVSSLYRTIKKDFSSYPRLLQTEINELSQSHNNYNTLSNTRKVQEKSQKNQMIALNCKKIEQKIFFDHYAKLIEYIKEEKAKYGRFLELNEFNQLITDDKIYDAISSLRVNVDNANKNSSEQLFERENIIRKLKKNLKLMRGQYHFQNQNQMTIAFSSIQNEENNLQYQNGFMNQNNSLTSMNLNNNYNNERNFSLNQESQSSLSPKTHTKTRNSKDSFAKIKKSFDSILKEQNRNLENTSHFISSVKESEILKRMHQSYYE